MIDTANLYKSLYYPLIKGTPNKKGFKRFL